MKITVDLTDEEAKRLHQWIAPQVRGAELRGIPITRRFKFDQMIAYRVWKAWINDDEHTNESGDPSTAQEHGSKP